MSIRKRKSKRAKKGYVYEVYFTKNNQRIYQLSGFKTRKEAEEHEALKKVELNEKGFISKQVKKTFKEVYEEFLEVDSTQYQPTTIYNTKKYYRYFEKELGKLPIVSIDYATIQKYFNGRKECGIESNKNVKKAMMRIFKYALKVGYIQFNPCMSVNVVGKENHKKTDNTLNHDDFILLTESLYMTNDFKRQAYSIAIQISYYTGLRISEVLALNKSDFDFERNLIHVNKKLEYKDLKKKDYYVSHTMKSKTSKATLPLAFALKEALEQWFKINPYEKVLCDIENYYLNPNVLSNIVKEHSKELGIKFNFHMLRHTFATNLVMGGVDLKIAQDLMRHSNINTTMSIYTHVTEQHKLDTLNSIFQPKSVEKVSNFNNQINSLN